ncbi:MAG: class I SAM-dependent methyltransferase, partial [Firmicutes bacterium]|nr:class I SAM-dependent methyltransferase [Bacillota bacterium]
HKFNPDNWQKLLTDERAEFLNPVRIVALTGIAAGETVVDVGAGAGFFIDAILEAVGPNGQVYAVDTSQEMLDKVGEVKGENPQVKLVKSDELSVPLEDRIADHVFLANVLHEIKTDERVPFLTEMRRLLRSTGRITIVEWKKEETPKGPPINHRLSREDVVSYLYAAGFRMRRTDEAGPYHYLIQASLKEGIFGGDYRP